MSKGGGLVFHGLIERPVASEKQLMRLLTSALHARTIGANYRHRRTALGMPCSY